ncbi:uncharacterized protein BJX67DRAFT_291919 [Aspergillus lucknowensis]|uniref:RING-type domain-containing protein n=1 Tax=Aspergillus lucknowensis TaxID=176173 RepID=A0ABR4LE12_9EURO
MDSAIYISSSSDDSDGKQFTEADEFFDQEDHWPRQIPNEASWTELTDRLAKKQRVRGPDVTGFDEASVVPLASLDPNSSHYLQDAPHQVAQLADATDSLLAEILEIFPDISHAYAVKLIDRHRPATKDPQPKAVQFALSKDAIYEEILGQKSYPKQEAENPKRKREDRGERDSNWENNTLYQSQANAYSRAGIEILGKEFPLIPMVYVRKVLSEKKRVYHAFLALHSDDNLLGQNERPFARLKKSRVSAAHHVSPPLCDILTSELSAAKRQAEKLECSLRKEKEEQEAEKANEEEHARTGNLIECQCCYSDVPTNRSVPCEGADLHFFCFTCIRKSAETQIGLMKYKLQCFAVSGCQAPFARSQLTNALGSSIMAKLDSLQQQDEVRMAGLEGLEDCPFCSFKAVLAPVEEDREFRCVNPSCKVVSCRLCKEESHIPKTCEEARKDKGISERHEVEEAMSKALIRNCPKCQVKIVKEDGCNKMSCPQCHTRMCYICQKDITKEGYNHFGRGCPQADADARARERREVKQAEKTAIEKILAENPDITEEQLRVVHTEPENTRSRHAPYEARRHMARAPPFYTERQPGMGLGRVPPLGPQNFQPAAVEPLGQPPQYLGANGPGGQLYEYAGMLDRLHHVRVSQQRRVTPQAAEYPVPGFPPAREVNPFELPQAPLREPAAQIYAQWDHQHLPAPAFDYNIRYQDPMRPFPARVPGIARENQISNPNDFHGTQNDKIL